MSNYLIFCYVVSTLIILGFLSMFFKGFKDRDFRGKALVIIVSFIFLGLFVFVNFNEYEKGQDARKIMEKIEPIRYIEKDTLDLYKIDGRYYRYAPRMNQLVYYSSSIDSVNVISE